MEFNLDFSQLRVLVIGDVMIDRYIKGATHRISPEAPVPVVVKQNQFDKLGGAANVAYNCQMLGAKVSLAAVIGDDQNGARLLNLLAAHDINTKLILKDESRPTTVKTRIVVKGQQLLRIDEESEAWIDGAIEHHFIDIVMRFIQIEKPDIVIFEDYNKGVLKANVIDKVLGHCKTVGIPTAIDPKSHNFFAYKGATIFKPNLKEVKEALDLGAIELNSEGLAQVHSTLHATLQHEYSFITLSENGVFVAGPDIQKIFPAHLRNIVDVSGAGDTVIAVAALTYAATRDIELMASASNIAGGLVCEQSGVVPITFEQLQQEYKRIYN